MADLCGVSLSTVSHWARIGLPGKQGKYDLKQIIPWLREHGPCNHGKRQVQSGDDDDPLLSDTDSPGLERYRQAKAAIAELDYAERQKELIARDKVKSLFGRWASVLRRMGERISKRFGNEAALTVNDALRECGEIVVYELGSADTPDTTAD